MSRDASEQRRITRIALEAAGPEAGFALAGSGAIREHGFIDRPTEDVDLFTTQSAQHKFAPALERVVAALQEAGYDVEIREQHPCFSRLVLSRGSAEPAVTVDLGVDWRAEDPVRLAVGPVLAPDDAVGNKVAALFSRGEARDYLDVDRIRASGRYQDRRLIELGHRADLGFEITQFVRRLEEVGRIQPFEVAIYEVSPEQLRAVKDRCLAWARELCARPVGDPIPPCGQVADSNGMPDPQN